MTVTPASRLGHLTKTEQKAAREFAAKVAQHFQEQVLAVMLFGSRARGEAEPESDMDLAVVLEDADPETRRTVRYLAVEVWLKYGIYLSTRVWSQAEWKKLEEMQTLLYRNVRRDGIEIQALVDSTHGE